MKKAFACAFYVPQIVNYRYNLIFILPKQPLKAFK